MIRREFFRGVLLLGLGFLGASLSWIFGSLWTAGSRFSSSRAVPVGSWNQFPDENVVPLPEYKIAILRRGREIAAISLECTHLGCLVNAVDRGFFCPCHGSNFGPRGEVYSGPAKDPLPWYEVMDREGRIWVYLGNKVKSPQWLEMKGDSPARSKRG